MSPSHLICRHNSRGRMNPPLTTPNLSINEQNFLQFFNSTFALIIIIYVLASLSLAACRRRPICRTRVCTESSSAWPHWSAPNRSRPWPRARRATRSPQKDTMHSSRHPQPNRPKCVHHPTPTSVWTAKISSTRSPSCRCTTSAET